MLGVALVQDACRFSASCFPDIIRAISYQQTVGIVFLRNCRIPCRSGFNLPRRRHTRRFIRAPQVTTQVLEESFGFRTQDDLNALFHGKKHLVVDLVNRKLRQGQWRWHPEFVGVEEVKQFWVSCKLKTGTSTALQGSAPSPSRRW